ncbi:MAG: TruB family pseudouridylate synthase [Parcubacteria group bacterium GW2011_GWA1_40_21]|nr:MAG: TruB family pseudouridylate synthase [Parcubacteria group bacterium GW2011_GWC1_40_13]KKR54057.1 MAG: TruB family pseudouridylate synthase [Parcubacteria group bacterium GW2011_GWA1_40_21]
MNKVLNIYKREGETPLEVINRFRANNPEYQSVKITYAGRLDPLAEGVLILLAGSAVYEKEKYLKLDKEYEAEIVFGFETDTYDILGLPKRKKVIKDFHKDELAGFLNKFLGKNKQPFPPYSSYKIKGKPLFEWSREEKIKDIKIPEKEREIYEIKILRLQKINGRNLLAQINKKIQKVKGDFRQEKILKKWQGILKDKPANKFQNFKNKMVHNFSDSRNCVPFSYSAEFQTAKIKIKCSSGTYIRSIAHKLGKDLKIGATLLNLKRTKVGDFEIKDSLKI